MVHDILQPSGFHEVLGSLASICKYHKSPSATGPQIHVYVGYDAKESKRNSKHIMDTNIHVHV